MFLFHVCFMIQDGGSLLSWTLKSRKAREGQEIGEGEGWQKLFPFYEDAQGGRFCYCPHFTDGEKTQAQGLAQSCLSTKL